MNSRELIEQVVIEHVRECFEILLGTDRCTAVFARPVGEEIEVGLMHDIGPDKFLVRWRIPYDAPPAAIESACSLLFESLNQSILGVLADGRMMV